MAKHVEKLEQQIEKMARKVQSQSTRKAVQFGTSERQLSPLAIRSKPAEALQGKNKRLSKFSGSAAAGFGSAILQKESKF